MNANSKNEDIIDMNNMNERKTEDTEQDINAFNLTGILTILKMKILVLILRLMKWN